jgi:hypothetical protein
MARRTNSPVKTTFLLIVLAGAGYLAYDLLVVRKVFDMGSGHVSVDDGQRKEIRDALLARLDKNPCFLELGPMSFRAKEDRWRIDLTVADGCIGDEAQDVCRSAAEVVMDDFRLQVSVWAYDDSGREIAHFIP